eukprot:s978_g13.t1
MGSNLSASGCWDRDAWVVVTPPAMPSPAKRSKGGKEREEESEDSGADHPDPPPPPTFSDRESSDRSVTPRHRREKAGTGTELAAVRLRGKVVPGLDEPLPDAPPPAPRGHKNTGRDRCEFCWKPVSMFQSGKEQHRWYNVRCLRWQRFLEGDCTWTYAGKWATRKAEERSCEEAPHEPPRATDGGGMEKSKRKKEKKAKRPEKWPSPSPDPPKKEKRHRRPPSSDGDEEPMPTIRKRVCVARAGVRRLCGFCETGADLAPGTAGRVN